MDEDMEIEEVFVVHEVDLGYEYDAPRFFDFTREETQDEAHELERWFESAKSYPPSPFAVKLLRGDNIHLATFNVSPKSKNPNASVHAACAGDTGEHQAIQPNGIDCDGIANGIFYNLESGRLLEVAKQHLSKGSGFQSGISSDKLKKKVIKDKPRSSTLMKPTASMLAKQFQPSEFISSRLQTQPGLVNRVLVTSGSEVQAGKRQKLEKGHMCKPVEANHQNILVHKAPKKKRKKFNLRKLEIHLPMDLTIIVFEGCFDTDGIEKISHSKLRLTIPREPDLKTAQRSTRMRPPNNNQMEDSAVSVRRFKARPLNRKILESSQLPLHQKSTPKLPEFKLFHLKTLERSAHSSSSVVPPQSSLIQSDNAKKELFEANNALSVAESMNKGAGRTSTAETQTQHGSQFLFQAHPLNRRVLSSKGDVGVLRNDKHGTTAPTFKFQSDKSSQQIPPTDLFSMLSLSSGKDNGPCSKIKSFRHLCTHSKVSKENRCSPFQPKQTLVTVRMSTRPTNFYSYHTNTR